MNYYLIWTEKGWLKKPTYTHVLCSGVLDFDLDRTADTTQDICRAYRLDERQTRECVDLLHRFGVASWVVELKDDIVEDVLKNIEQKRKEKTNG